MSARTASVAYPRPWYAGDIVYPILISTGFVFGRAQTHIADEVTGGPVLDGELRPSARGAGGARRHLVDLGTDARRIGPLPSLVAMYGGV